MTASGSCSGPWRNPTPSVPRPCRMLLTCWHPWVRSGLCCQYAWARRRRNSWLMDSGKKMCRNKRTDVSAIRLYFQSVLFIASKTWAVQNIMTFTNHFLLFPVTSWTTRFSTSIPTWWECWACTRLSWRSWSTCWEETSRRYDHILTFCDSLGLPVFFSSCGQLQLSAVKLLL